MSKHDSQSDDFLPDLADIEAQMRQNRPQISPMSPTTKRRLRAQLLENTRMNEPKLTMNRLMSALAALILIVGIPLYFWTIQSSLSNGAGSQPEGISAQLDATATPIPALTSTPLPPTVEPIATSDPNTPTPTPAPLVEPTVAPFVEAHIVEIGEPVPSENENSGAPAGTFYTVPVEVAYTLQGYEEALLYVGYTLEESNGSASGNHVKSILAENNGTVTAELNLSRTYILADGRINPDITFDIHINAYDEMAEQYVNIFPGDLELASDEQNMPYPYRDPATTDFIALNAVTITDMSDEELELTLSMHTAVRSDDEGELTAVIYRNETELASTTITVTQESSVVSLPIRVTTQPEDSPLTVAVTLDVGDDESTATKSVPLPELMTAESNSVWLIEMIAEENGEVVLFTAVVGYRLDEPYIGGIVNHSISYTAPDGSGGGGGGGGSNSGGNGSNPNLLPLGTGVVSFQFGLGDPNLTIDNWEELLIMQIQLMGVTADGTQTLLDVD